MGSVSISISDEIIDIKRSMISHNKKMMLQYLFNVVADILMYSVIFLLCIMYMFL